MLVPVVCVAQPSTRTDLKDITADTLAADYAAERAHRPDDAKPLRIGLALSGGGTKAGMFAHGVLHGLHDANVLARVDAISSVSGGSYAAYWYMSKYMESARSGTPAFSLSQIFDDCVPSYWTANGRDPDIKAAMAAAVARPPKPGMAECENAAHFRARGSSGIDDPYRWQAHIARWPDVLQVEPMRVDGGRQGSPEREIWRALGASAHEAKTRSGKAELPWLYQYGIERTWGLNPAPRDAVLVAANDRVPEQLKWQYTNSARNDANILHADDKLQQWSQLNAIYGDARVSATPPLWIVNATDGARQAGSNTSRIFEMTPFGFGSANREHAGYFNLTPAPPLPIANLGASVRASAAFSDPQAVRSGRTHDAVSLLAKWIPAGQWGVEVDMQVPGGKGVRLSDGGESEDLGVYSLLKRGLDDIIVVDTAWDPAGTMPSLCELNAALKTDGVEIKFPALRNLAEVCAAKSKLAYNVSDWKNPVVKGTATWRNADGTPRRVARLWLIKAAWDERAVDAAYNNPDRCGSSVGQINCLLTVFYGHNRKARSLLDNYMHFPQHITVGTTLNSSSYLFWGYRELGRMLAANLRVDAAGRLELLDDRQCWQETRPRRKFSRPELMRFQSPSGCELLREPSPQPSP